MLLFNKKSASILFLLFITLSYSQEKEIELSGTVIDNTKNPVPFAAIGIPSKFIGTSGTIEGAFNLVLSNTHLSDTLEVSSIGYKTWKVKIEDFLKKKEKFIILEEDISTLDEVSILSSIDYVKNAFKNLKNTAISKKHQLNILYRRFSSEDERSRFLVEQYIKVLDYGPKIPDYTRAEVIEGRKSLDYRIIKEKFWGHQVFITPKRNPLRSGLNIKKYKWSKIGDTSYDGEDLVIVEGVEKKNSWNKIKFYIGVTSYGVYKVESTDLNAIWIYKKADNGKLVLSYHNREWKKDAKIDNIEKQLLKAKSNKIKLSYIHELFVLGVEVNKKNIKVGNYEGYVKDMGDLDIKYNPYFWKNFNSPPETAFYKKNVKELESARGVPLEVQFNSANK